MLIGIDASRAVRRLRSGTENYSYHLIRSLLEAESCYRYRLYSNQPMPSGLFPPGPWKARVMPLPRLWTHLRLSWEVFPSHPSHPRSLVPGVVDLVPCPCGGASPC